VDGELLIDTPAGLFRARPTHRATDMSAVARIAKADASASCVTSVTVTGVPSFVHSAGLRLAIGTRTLAVDIAFGGEFYAIADSEAIGIPIEMANAAALIRMGREIQDAVDSAVQVRHPIDSTLRGIQGTIFTAASPYWSRLAKRHGTGGGGASPIARSHGQRRADGDTLRDGRAARGTRIHPRGRTREPAWQVVQ
jgi:proline racemase